MKELVRKITYMFYEKEKVMIMEGFLMFDEPMTLKEIGEKLHLQKKIIDDCIGILRRDGMISSKQTLDLEGWDLTKKPISQMSDTQKKNRTVYYYAIDYKVFCDSVRLKIQLVKNHLKKLCGKADNISYRCESCHTTFNFIEINRLSEYSNFTCPECGGTLKDLDNSDEVNANKRKYEEFCHLTDDIIRQITNLVSNMVFEDDFDFRTNPAKLMTLESYNAKEKYIKENAESGKIIRAEEKVDTDKQNVVDVKTVDIGPAIDDSIKDLFTRNTQATKKTEQAEEQEPEIVIDGQVLKKSDVTEDFIINYTGSTENMKKLEEFHEKYCQ